VFSSWCDSACLISFVNWDLGRGLTGHSVDGVSGAENAARADNA